MTPKTKKIIIVGGSLLVIGGIIGYIFWKQKKDKENALTKPSDSATDTNTGGGNTDTNTGGVNTDTSTGGGTIGSGTTGGGKPKTSSVDEVLANLGASAKKVGDVVNAKFNNGKNLATFYSNNRVIIFGVVNSKLQRVASGSYSNGGKSIKMDSGKSITSGSVWANLLSTLKK